MNATATTTAAVAADVATRDYAQGFFINPNGYGFHARCKECGEAKAGSPSGWMLGHAQRCPAQVTTDAPEVGPCGCSGCDKWADCAYCGTCIERDPWIQVDAEILADQQYDRENAGSFADWLNGRNA